MGRLSPVPHLLLVPHLSSMPRLLYVRHLLFVPRLPLLAHLLLVARLLLVTALAAALAGCGPAEQPLFRELGPEHTGVDFVNRVEDTPELNIINYLYFYDGGGVAIGDVDGDGLPDLYFTANDGPNHLYLNRGNTRFEDVTDAAGVAGSSDWNTGVTMADVNGDGLLDIYVSAVDGFLGLTGRNELFVNNGDGTFSERAAAFGLDFRGYATQAAFFDFDLDGDLDAFLLNHSTHDEETYGQASMRSERHARAGDRLYRNDDGRFVDVSEEAGIYGGPVGYGLGVSVSDLNVDGWPDMYVANDFHENDYLYVNNGDGTFTDVIRHATAHNSRSSMGSDAADINNDGLADIVVLDMLPSDETILKTSASIEGRVLSGMKLQYGYYHQYTRNTLQLNRGDGRFSDIGQLAGIEATDWSWAALFCDLDNDGWKDLFVTNGIWRRPNDLDYIEAVSSEAMQERLEEISEEDLAILEQMPHVAISNHAFRNNGNMAFTDRAADWGLGPEGFSNGAAYGDLDNDGDLDLVINNINEAAGIYENRGGGGSVTLALEGEGANTFGVGARAIVRAGDHTQVQELFPTRGFQSSVDPRLHFGLDTLTIVESVTVIWPDRRYQTFRDIPADTHLTVRQRDASGRFDYTGYRALFRGHAGGEIFAETSVPIDYVHRENEFVDFTREPLIPHKISTEGPALAVGDVDGDGLDDLFTGGAKWQAASLWIQTPSGSFVPSSEGLWQADSLHEDVDAAFFDVEGDGDLDLYVVSAGNEWWGEADALLDRLYVNDGSGNFSRGDLPAIYENGSVVRPADFDGDGDVDLFVGGRVVSRRYGESPRSYLLRNDGGRFVHATPDVLARPGMVTDAAWGDYDGDGALDLAVVAEWSPPRIYLARGDGFEPIEIAAPGWWSAVAASDVDADGSVDLILGNLGLNSRLRASSEEPVRLYMGDFDANGEIDHILTSYRGGVSYPLATRDELVEAFPSLARTFPTYASYGASRIEDILPKELLAEAQVLHAEEFASMVALNRGGGKFELRELPATAQFAPVKAVLVDDLDRDGHEDLLLGGNVFVVMPARGRYDASYGAFLRGDGSGGFMSVEPVDSGLWLEGEIREMILLDDAAGRRLLFAARNGNSLQVVAIAGADSARALRNGSVAMGR